MQRIVFALISAGILAACSGQGNISGDTMTAGQRQDMYAAGNAAMIAVGTAK